MWLLAGTLKPWWRWIFSSFSLCMHSQYVCKHKIKNYEGTFWLASFIWHLFIWNYFKKTLTSGGLFLFFFLGGGMGKFKVKTSPHRGLIDKRFTWWWSFTFLKCIYSFFQMNIRTWDTHTWCKKGTKCTQNKQRQN